MARIKPVRGSSSALLLGAIGLFGWMLGQVIAADVPGLSPLPEAKVNKEMAELGRYLFFDTRLSGDSAKSCASCHDPAKGWGDGQPLSAGYTSVEYFRNAPTLLNAR